MDWNRSNTILIIAFIILNIFLLISTFSNVFTENFNVYLDKDFLEDVESLLKSKNININCEIPEEIYVLPVLDTDYEMIEVNNALVQKYLGKSVEAKEDVYSYTNDKNEILEIIDGKKIKFTKRNLIKGKINDTELINNSIKAFITENDINDSGFTESYKYISENGSYVTYTQNYNDNSLDNSYMKFLFDKEGMYEFEMQKINAVIEIKDKIRTISAIEALPRLMTYDDIKDKNIVSIKMKYYSIENGNWKYIKKINADPTWKVIFSDGSQKYLSSFD
ncbi:regulatory protein YycI of two-component signal transduction system YycFG [Sedimentibacter acidaminivorans]|uniref:Regulatory protein YycI of two-component signal transduction system YycFG n=1 Tax=Sedimentibacter acidaminivorans TaxID=913099 RepID=A0ABS4GH77_9FIRM|nr:two-component system regulatory protein YycI [Sedimentibacter acidaminivorans]MBP1927048.1 regulatory protein YycI of two-component signal transduction system YycFG [Sedimentibacter acidaminivorans]